MNEGARLSLLRCLATLEDYGRDKEHWPAWTPLFEGEWEHSNDDMILAVQEATKLGHIESTALHVSGDHIDRFIADMRGGRDYMVKITPSGYAWIRAHDLTGELEQDGARVKV